MRYPKTGTSPAAVIPLLRRGGEVLWEIALLLGLGLAVLLWHEILLQQTPRSPYFRYEAELYTVGAAVERYQAGCGVLPARLGDLRGAAAAEGGCAPSALSFTAQLRDAWDSPYHYLPDAGRFTLRSAGRDRVVFTADDIVLGDPARAWRAHYQQPTDWLRLSLALATVLLAVLFVAKSVNLLWRGALACGRVVLRQRVVS